MPAFFIASVTVKDPAKFQEYSGKAGQSLAQFGGKLLVRGQAQDVLAGAATPGAAAVVNFPDLKALRDWFASDTYQALIPLRDAACDMSLVSFETPA